MRAAARRPLSLAGSWAALMGLLLIACGAESPVVTPTPDGPTAAVPDTLQGINLTRLEALAGQIGGGARFPGVHSLLVQRRGVLVFERYFDGGAPGERHTLQSVTKSFASALVGIAVARGDIESPDERVLDFFPEWDAELGADAWRSAMRVEDVLTMRTGTDYNESGPSSPHAELNALRSGWDRFWLERPMVSHPGTAWQYDSGGVVALSSMLRRRSGMHADAYAQEHLFGPLAIDDARWSTNEEGHPHTGGGLFLTSRDALKLGRLYLQKGRWEGTQLIPESWVDASLERHHTFPAPRGNAGRIEGYGYLWWVLAPDPGGSGSADIYAALGYRGQAIFVVPEHDLVVVATGWIEPGAPQGPIDLLYGEVLPAVLR